MSTVPHDRRFGHLDGLRGLASFVVVSCHFFMAFYPAAVFGRGAATHGAWETWLAHTPLGIATSGTYAVCLFFFLSGFVLPLKYFSSNDDVDILRVAMVKRAPRLLGLLLLCAIAATALQSAGLLQNQDAAPLVGARSWLGIWWKTPLTWSEAFRTLVFKPFEAGERFNPPMWTIEMELRGSLLVFVTALVLRRAPRRWLGYVALLFVCRSDHYLLFIVGMILADAHVSFARLREPSRATQAAAWCALGVGLVLGGFPGNIAPEEIGSTFYRWLPPGDWVDFGWPTVAAFATLFGVLYVKPAHRVLGSKPLRLLGRISFALYAAHALVLCSVSSILFVRWAPTISYDKAAALDGAALLAVLFPVSYVLTRWFDEPVVRFCDRMAKWALTLVVPGRARQ